MKRIEIALAMALLLAVATPQLAHGEWTISDGSFCLLCDQLNPYTYFPELEEAYSASDPKVSEFAGLE